MANQISNNLGNSATPTVNPGAAKKSSGPTRAQQLNALERASDTVQKNALGAPAPLVEQPTLGDWDPAADPQRAAGAVQLFMPLAELLSPEPPKDLEPEPAFKGPVTIPAPATVKIPPALMSKLGRTIVVFSKQEQTKLARAIESVHARGVARLANASIGAKMQHDAKFQLLMAALGPVLTKTKVNITPALGTKTGGGAAASGSNDAGPAMTSGAQTAAVPAEVSGNEAMPGGVLGDGQPVLGAPGGGQQDPQTGKVYAVTAIANFGPGQAPSMQDATSKMIAQMTQEGGIDGFIEGVLFAVSQGDEEDLRDAAEQLQQINTQKAAQTKVYDMLNQAQADMAAQMQTEFTELQAAGKIDPTWTLQDYEGWRKVAVSSPETNPDGSLKVDADGNPIMPPPQLADPSPPTDLPSSFAGPNPAAGAPPDSGSSPTSNSTNNDPATAWGLTDSQYSMLKSYFDANVPKSDPYAGDFSGWLEHVVKIKHTDGSYQKAQANNKAIDTWLNNSAAAPTNKQQSADNLKKLQDDFTALQTAAEDYNKGKGSAADVAAAMAKLTRDEKSLYISPDDKKTFQKDFNKSTAISKATEKIDSQDPVQQAARRASDAAIDLGVVPGLPNATDQEMAIYEVLLATPKSVQETWFSGAAMSKPPTPQQIQDLAEEMNNDGDKSWPFAVAVKAEEGKEKTLSGEAVDNRLTGDLSDVGGLEKQLLAAKTPAEYKAIDKKLAAALDKLTSDMKSAKLTPSDAAAFMKKYNAVASIGSALPSLTFQLLQGASLQTIPTKPADEHGPTSKQIEDMKKTQKSAETTLDNQACYGFGLSALEATEAKEMWEDLTPAEQKEYGSMGNYLANIVGLEAPGANGYSAAANSAALLAGAQQQAAANPSDPLWSNRVAALQASTEPQLDVANFGLPAGDASEALNTWAEMGPGARASFGGDFSGFLSSLNLTPGDTAGNEQKLAATVQTLQQNGSLSSANANKISAALQLNANALGTSYGFSDEESAVLQKVWQHLPPATRAKYGGDINQWLQQEVGIKPNGDQSQNEAKVDAWMKNAENEIDNGAPFSGESAGALHVASAAAEKAGVPPIDLKSKKPSGKHDLVMQAGAAKAGVVSPLSGLISTKKAKEAAPSSEYSDLKNDWGSAKKGDYNADGDSEFIHNLKNGAPPLPTPTQTNAASDPGTQTIPPGQEAGAQLMSLTQLAAASQTAHDAAGSLGDVSQEWSMRVQEYNDRRSQAYESLSNIMKTVSDAANAIIDNIKI